ncbi:MAG: DUF1573 domain-containing protein [bacterium]|nr:DUF1573 domain-containing protein [bacterium]
MKPIIFTFLVLFAVVGVLVWGLGNTGKTIPIQGDPSLSEKSALDAPEMLYNFGRISMKKGDVFKEFAFSNPTDKDITIQDIRTSCMCTLAYLLLPDGSTKGPFGMAGMSGSTATDDTIKAGETRVIRAVYDPNAHGPAGVGSINRFITITDSSGGRITFEIKALVTP